MGSGRVGHDLVTKQQLMRNQGPERRENMPKVTQLISDEPDTPSASGLDPIVIGSCQNHMRSPRRYS